MDYSIQEEAFSILVRLDEWTKSSEVKPGETGRVIATVLAIIIISYAILLLARLVEALTLPALVIMCFLVIYRCVNVVDLVEGFKQLPCILDSFIYYIADFIQKAQYIRWGFALCYKVLNLIIRTSSLIFQ